MHISWDELQTVEALVRGGSVEAAGRELALRHTSVSRRVLALEKRLGASLFVRGPRLVPTPLGLQVAGRAEVMRTAASDIEGFVEAEQRRREGSFVMTTSDVLAPLLCRALGEVQLSQNIELRVSDEELELSPGQVDLALRPSQAPSAHLRGHRLGRLRVGIYSAPRSGATWVLPDASLRAKASMRWWRHVPQAAPGAIVCNSLLAMREACVAGVGRAALPSFLLHGNTQVQLDREVDGGPPIWLLAPATRGRSAISVRKAQMALGQALRAVSGAFETAR